LSYRVPCVYSGTFKVGGVQYSLLLTDTDGKGRFDDRAKIADRQYPHGNNPVYPQGNVVYLTDGGKLEEIDFMYLGDLLLINNTLFDLKIDIPKKKMTLNEIKDGLLPLKLSAVPERLSLYTADGGHVLMGYKLSGDVIKLPAGTYKLIKYQVLRKDKQRDLWKINAAGTNESPVATVAKDRAAFLSFGEPYTPKVFLHQGEIIDVEQLGLHGIITLNFDIEGVGKEVLLGLTRIQGTGTKIPLSKKTGLENRPQEPSYTIVRASGEIVAKGSFEYG